MPSTCACGCGGRVAAPGHHIKGYRERLIKQGIPCPPNIKSSQHHALRLAVQQHGPQQKDQRANAVTGLAPMTFQPLVPHIQQKLDAIKASSRIYNPINHPIYNPIHNPINNPINIKRRKLENCAKNKQTVQENPNLSATDKMSDGKHASICNCHTIPSMEIAVHVYGLYKLDIFCKANHLM